MRKIFSSYHIIYFLIFSLLLTTPLPYGSVTPGGKLMLQIQSFLLLFIYCVNRYKNQKSVLDFESKYQILALAGFITICIMQITPLPGFVLSMLSEKTFEIWTTSEEILSILGSQSGKTFYTISLDPHRTWVNIVQILA